MFAFGLKEWKNDFFKIRRHLAFVIDSSDWNVLKTFNVEGVFSRWDVR